jgi:hypothetical protein
MGATDQAVFLPLFGLLAVTAVVGGLAALTLAGETGPECSACSFARL